MYVILIPTRCVVEKDHRTVISSEVERSGVPSMLRGHWPSPYQDSRCLHTTRTLGTLKMTLSRHPGRRR